MTRNLKALGLALLACFALSAVAASGASAAQDVFTSTAISDSTNLTGVSLEEPVLTRGGAEIKCPEATYEGTIEGDKVTDVQIYPEYGHTEEVCESLEPNDSIVHTEGCTFKLTGETHKIVEEKTVDAEHATVHVECTPEHEITVTVPSVGITLHIGSQTPTGGVTYKTITTTGSEDGEVTVKATVTGIKSTCTGGAFACFLAGGATNNNGSYTDHVLVKGYEDTKTFTQNETTHNWTGEHGPQTDIGVKTHE